MTLSIPLYIKLPLNVRCDTTQNVVIFVHSLADETFLKLAIISLLPTKSVLLVIPEFEFDGIRVTSISFPGEDLFLKKMLHYLMFFDICPTC